MQRPGRVRHPQLKVAYVVEPCFPGGTSSAVAAELEAVISLAQVEVHGITTTMFSDRRIAPQLSRVMVRHGIPFYLDSAEITADVIIFHNPSCLKFQDSLTTRFIARHLIAVTHENFLRPGGAAAFDVEKCLSLIAANALVLKRSLAPISRHNRTTVDDWRRTSGFHDDWTVLDEDWFNICAPRMSSPTKSPRDRRGRLSRPGFEKFPGREVLQLCFPKEAESNVILGADHLLASGDSPAHWTLHPFGALTVERFFDTIDFFVYYTAPTWRESFGRVVAEAIAAGKIAITDEDTATGFGGAAIAAAPENISGIVAGYLSDPETYGRDVLLAQKTLGQFSESEFQKRFSSVLADKAGLGQ